MVTGFHAPYLQESYRLFVCLDCLRLTCSKRTDLRKLLERYLNHLTREFTHCRDYSECPMVDSDFHADTHTHDWVEGRFHSGQLNERAIRDLLGRFAPSLLNPSLHFDERKTPSPEIHDELKRKGMDDLLYPDVLPSSVKTYQGPKPERDDKGLEKYQSRAAIEFGIAYSSFSSGIHSKRQVTAVAESSLPRLMALIRGNLAPALWKIEQELGNSAGGGAGVERAWSADQQSVFTWRVFDKYLDIYGDVELMGKMSERWLDGVPRLDEALELLDLSPDQIRLMLGDVAVIQYAVDPQRTLFPGVRTYADLFKTLRDFGYPRPDATRDNDPGQAFSMYLRAIAHPLTVVRVNEVDWQPVMSRITFKRSP